MPSLDSVAGMSPVVPIYLHPLWIWPVSIPWPSLTPLRVPYRRSSAESMSLWHPTSAQAPCNHICVTWTHPHACARHTATTTPNYSCTMSLNLAPAVGNPSHDPTNVTLYQGVRVWNLFGRYSCLCEGGVQKFSSSRQSRRIWSDHIQAQVHSGCVFPPVVLRILVGMVLRNDPTTHRFSHWRLYGRAVWQFAHMWQCWGARLGLLVQATFRRVNSVLTGNSFVWAAQKQHHAARCRAQSST